MKNILLLLVVSPTTCGKRYRVEVSGASRNISPASIRDIVSSLRLYISRLPPHLGNTSIINAVLGSFPESPRAATWTRNDFDQTQTIMLPCPTLFAGSLHLNDVSSHYQHYARTCLATKDVIQIQ